MIQTCGSYDEATDSYTVTVANEGIGLTLESLTRHEVESLADLALCLLFSDEDEYTWHHEFEPNDVM